MRLCYNVLKLKRFGCRVEFVSFAEEDPDKIGFAGDGRTPLVVYKNDTVQSVIYPRNTIVLDLYLLQGREENRRRFVLGHEARHMSANWIPPALRAFIGNMIKREFIPSPICKLVTKSENGKQTPLLPHY